MKNCQVNNQIMTILWQKRNESFLFSNICKAAQFDMKNTVTEIKREK